MLVPALDELCGAEGEAGPEGGQEAAEAVLKDGEVLCARHSGGGGHHLLAAAVRHEENAVLSNIGGQGGNSSRVQTWTNSLKNILNTTFARDNAYKKICNGFFTKS